jgi:hypothetical protein
MCEDLSGRLSATICVILMLVGVAVGLRMLLGQSTPAAIAQGTDIVVNGADYTSTIATENSSDLINIAQNVTPRFITEYADFGHGFGLQESDALNQAAEVVQPRIIIEYADYATTLALSPYLGPLPYPNETSLPSIVITREPPEPEVNESIPVIVSANVNDTESGVKNATLQYTLDNTTNWSSAYLIPMSLNLTLQPQNSLALSFNATIPGQPSGTRVRFRIIAYDFAGNSATKDGVTDATTYLVVPEFPSFLVIPLFMIATLLAVIVYRRKHSSKLT